MSLFEPFSHYLAYGATDQKTFLDVARAYDGIVVPATIAAWQRQGTGGFVLSLSASSHAPPYVIDPRFPLFQQGLVDPKASHLALADILGDADLVAPIDPTPDVFPESRLERLARKWVEFNRGYGASSSEKFDKYAERLGEPIAVEQAQAPEAILAPYFASSGAQDPWWIKSKRLFELTAAASGTGIVYRVVCATYPGAIGALLSDLPQHERSIVWVSGLDEYSASAQELWAYRAAIEETSSRGQETFALYGGFFSVLLSSTGLHGESHGVGFGESRNWRELPQSGAPPSRYYLQRFHRYVSQDLAQVLVDGLPDLAPCGCESCSGRDPNELDYHDLMKHSVWCRAREIEHWKDEEPVTAAERLNDEYQLLANEIRGAGLPPAIRLRALSSLEHLPRWAEALAL
jgi:hypothetical protein